MRFRHVLLLAAASFIAAPASAAEAIKWTHWDADTFSRAKAEKRFVILDLEAVWCHWCHVMDQKTYANPKIQDLIGAKYLAVRADQDANPDLSNRYGDWGWPATIIFGPDGTEIAKMRGYVEPERMEAVLKAVIEDPSPGPSAAAAAAVKPSTSAFLTKDQRAKMIKTFEDAYDTKVGGWGSGYKYIDADSMDYALTRAQRGDTTAADHARQTFGEATAIMDPVWGGVYQYSIDDEGDWKSPHFEKLMSFQAQYLRQYSQAYARWKDPKYLEVARSIEKYMTTFLLGPEGAFYVSQDADLNHDVDGHKYYALDDPARRKLGIPRVDKHMYARENGWAISGLVALYDATGDADVLAKALRAAQWIEANRKLSDGGFKHGDDDRGGPYLGDTLSMGQAFLDLYAATGDRQWLTKAAAAAEFIGAGFKDSAGGYLTSKTSEGKVGVFAKPATLLDEQTQVARFMNMLHQYYGKDVYKDLAAHAMRYVAGAAPGMERPLPGVLLADDQVALDPTHITVVGHKDDPEARKLFAAGLAYPSNYKRIEWWDAREGPLPNPDVDYPEQAKAAAFACSNHICSLPSFTTAELDKAIQQMAKGQPTRESKN